MNNTLIVGSTGVIGSAITEKLQAHQLTTISRQTPTKVSSNHLYMDLSKPISLHEASHKLTNLNSLDNLIWCPGSQLVTLFDEMPLDALDAQYNLSVRNLSLFVQLCLPKLKQSDNGRIIVISSIWGDTGASCEAGYAAMKGAQHALVKSLAKEFASTNVTVNAVSPGAVKSAMMREFSEEDNDAVLNEIPQHRYVEPNEVAHAVQYLISNEARSVTGEIMKINGGWYT